MKRQGDNLKAGISPRRISRSLVVILVALFVQVAPGPISHYTYAPAQAADNAISQTGLIFNANAAIGADDFGSNFNFVGTNSPSTSRPGYYTFDGSGTRYAYKNLDYQNGGSISLFTWIYPQADGVVVNLVDSSGTAIGYTASVITYSSNKFRFGLYAAGINPIIADVNTPVKNWYYVGLTYSAGQLTAYVNGVSVGTKAIGTWQTAGQTLGSNFFQISTAQNGSPISSVTNAGTFRMNSFSAYNIALDSSTVSSNYSATKSRFAPTFNSPVGGTIYTNRSATMSTFCATVLSNDGSSTCTYQWEVSTDAGVTWNNATGASTGVTYVTPIYTSPGTYRYRIKVTDPGISSPTSVPLWVYSSTTNVIVVSQPGGDTDTALTLVSSDSQAAMAYDAPGFEMTGDFTFEAWVNPTSTTGTRVIASKDNGYAFFIKNGYWGYGIAPSGGSISFNDTTTALAVANEWHHIAFTRAANSSTINFYLDGYLVWTGTQSNLLNQSIADSAGDFAIGGFSRAASWQSGYYFSGAIDQIAAWGAVRTESDIRSDLKSYITTNDANLRYYYDCNEVTGTSLINRKYNAADSTDLVFTSSGKPTFVRIDSETVSGPYTIVKFPRSYISVNGGWKSPANIKRVTTLVVGGGGGGGGGYQGGGGGAGGFIETTTAITPSLNYPIVVGAGGRGTINPIPATNGDTSTAFGLVAIGGGRGASEYDLFYGGQWNNHVEPANSGGSGGGGSWGTNNHDGGAGTPGQGNSGGVGGGIDSPINFAGSGGGGAGSIGKNPTETFTIGGVGGDGLLSAILGERIAGGGGGGSRYSQASDGTSRMGAGRDGGGNSAWDRTVKMVGVTGGATSGRVNSGGGGGAGISYTGDSPGYAGNGGSGIVAVRYITATKPSYTKPVNTYINVGMTETFTVNVATDSATAGLTRTFTWESTTAGETGTYTSIKVGTGAQNAFFAWVPTDTSTSGSMYLYRLTVTDSDTAGLFITDSSTAYALINPAIKSTGSRSISKTINLPRSESYTLSLGSPPYKVTMSPVIAGITLDTSTATEPVLRISDTATIGTYYETITVIDSVTGTLVIPLTIRILPPPNLVQSSQSIDNGAIFYFDAANSASLNPATLAAADISGSKRVLTLHGTGGAPTYTSDFLGAITLSDTNFNYLKVASVPRMETFTLQTTFRLDKTIGSFDRKLICSQEAADGSFNYCLSINFDGTPMLKIKLPSSPGNIFFASDTLTAGRWYDLAVSFDGKTAKFYINGVAAGGSSNNTFLTAGGDAVAPIYFGKPAVATAVNWFEMTPETISTIRIYNRLLSAAEIATNYASILPRLTPPVSTFLQPSITYPATLQETFTIFSGGDTKTITFANGNITGAKWDTSTAGSLKLSINDSMTGGTYYETVTVTDEFGASTFLPFKFYLKGGETLTITMDTATTVVYNGKPITIYPKVRIKGLLGSDSATVSTRFSSATYTETSTVPTDVDTYTVRGTVPVFSSGTANNYVAIVYETSTATVTKAKQDPLNVARYGAYLGQSFYISVLGGSGDGAVSETITSGSTAPNCSLSNHYLSTSATELSYCVITVSKGSSKNYLSESATVQIYFLPVYNAQPAPPAGSGPTISISGSTALTKDDSATVRAPSISGLSTYSAAVGDSVIITGEAFGNQATTVVKLGRSTDTISYVVNSPTQITITILSGARTAAVVVVTANGITFSDTPLTIVP